MAHGTIVLYDAHSIRSVVPRLFDGRLPDLNLGTHGGRSCSAVLAQSIGAICEASTYSFARDGRFNGGYITRHYGQPDCGVHAVQMELACRSYLREPQSAVGPHNWPAPYDPDYAATLRELLARVLNACVDFAVSTPRTFA